MTTSVIIPSYNGEKRIANTLKALIEQTHKNFEVIVAIDGSKDQTERIANDFKKQLDLKVFTQPNKGRAAIRNLGAKNASGDLFIFCDDDMIPSLDSVKKHREFHLQNVNAILTGDQVEHVEPQKTDIQNYKAWLTKRWTAKYTHDLTRLNHANLFFTAANCSIPRSIFEQLNGFDERLTDAEDFDFATKALDAGCFVYFDKKNISIHRDLITCRSYIKRQREYAEARVKRNELKGLASRTNSVFLKHVLYWPFAFDFWVKAIDKEKLMQWPKRIRYKLYDLVIHSLSVEYPNVRLPLN